MSPTDFGGDVAKILSKCRHVFMSLLVLFRRHVWRLFRRYFGLLLAENFEVLGPMLVSSPIQTGLLGCVSIDVVHSGKVGGGSFSWGCICIEF